MDAKTLRERFEKDAVQWESTSTNPEVKDDFMFKCGDYMLRVEQLDRRCWWWCVYLNNDEIESSNLKGSVKTEVEAKLSAELCFVRHKSITTPTREFAEGIVKNQKAFDDEVVHCHYCYVFENAQRIIPHTDSCLVLKAEQYLKENG